MGSAFMLKGVEIFPAESASEIDMTDHGFRLSRNLPIRPATLRGRIDERVRL